jgi:ATP-binding protein involved in chromosome partitioning
MSFSKESITRALRGVPAAGAGGDLVSAGVLKWVSVCESYVSVKLLMPAGATPGDIGQVTSMTRAAIESAATDEGVKLDSIILEFVSDAGDVVRTARFGAPAGAAPGQQGSQGLQGSSGPQDMGHRPIGGLADTRGAGQTRAPTPQGAHHRGGRGQGRRGQEHVALNLAVGLARRGPAVGLLDGDIYGPSLPTMLGLTRWSRSWWRFMLQPFLVHGVKAHDDREAGGPRQAADLARADGARRVQAVGGADAWGELDYLIIDLPPGTGDVALTMAQIAEADGRGGGVHAAEGGAGRRGACGADVPAAADRGAGRGGEHEHYFVGDDGKEYDIFGRGGAEKMAQRLGVPFLGAVPIHREFGEQRP